ncbi:MAG TPA: beta-galactosidase [Petrimonas sp.]|nr:beta-galactosidase [Petrimonas sp.]
MRMRFFLLLGVSLLLGCTHPADTIDLAGEWRFALDPDDIGVSEQWYARTFSQSVYLPGSLQEQGYGYDVSVDTKWTGSIHDRSWYDAPEYEKYRKEGNIKVPFWLNPDKHYVGVAWYQKDVRVPSGWKGKVIQLELERSHWETTLYVDGVELGKRDGLSTPHRYLLSDLESGKHVVTVRVDNRVHVDVGINAHSVSDHTQSNWNGLAGNLELTAKPSVYIDDVQVYPDVANRRVTVMVSLMGKAESSKGVVSLQLETLKGEPVGETVHVDFDTLANHTELNVTIDAGEEVLLWSEHSPNLYRLKSVVTSDGEKDGRYTRFGFREFQKRGTRFHLNGSPVFLRGTLECSIFPLTGYPATENAYWEKIYSACKKFGLNHVRFHSWCPPKAAFHVADSMGIYLQVECAGWATIGDGGYIDEWFYAEGDRILKEYGNHPSFCMLAYGNEPGGRNQVKYLSDLVAYWKSKDNRRVYTGGAGWPYIENADYWNAPDPRIQAWGEGLNSIINAQPPRSDFDFRDRIKGDMPTVSHEIGQWCVYPNFSEIEKYTGVLKAKNFEIFQETLQENKMGDLADDFLFASGRLQTLCYKADIEAALRTPGLAGFQLLDLHDFPGQGTALVGVLDAFWDEKGYVGGEEYSMFCNQTVPLVRFPKMTWLNNEKMSVPIEFAHFGEEPIKDARIEWTIATADDRIIKEGSFVSDLPLDNGIQVGRIEASFEEIVEPTRLIVSVRLSDKAIENQWNIWVYPKEKHDVTNKPFITSTFDDSVIDRLNQGESVLLLSPKGKVLPEKGGDIAVGFSSIFWNTAWTSQQPPHTLGVLCDPAHPALASFPNQGYSDYQWWDVVTDCDAMVLDEFPDDFRPIVYLIDDWFKNRWLGLLFEAKVGKGKLMVCSSSLARDPIQYPAAAQFKQSLIEYTSSDKFNPKSELDAELIRGLFSNP